MSLATRISTNIRMRSNLIDELQKEGLERIKAGMLARRIEDADPDDLAFAVNQHIATGGLVFGVNAVSAVTADAFKNGVYAFALQLAGFVPPVAGTIADFFKSLLDWISDPANQEKIRNAINFIMTVIVPLFL